MPNPITSWYALSEGGGTKWTRRGRTSFTLGAGFDDTGTPPAQAPNPPGALTAVKSPANPTSQINVSWTAPGVDSTHDAHTGYRVYLNGTQRGADLAAAALSYTITGLTAGTTYAVTVRAFNASGLSTAPTSRSVTLDGGTSGVTMLMGCSDSNNDHGGTEVWDGWRVYTKAAMTARANRTGNQRPVYLSYSKDGGNLGGSNPNYQNVFNEARTDLDEFYYGGSGQTRSSRWGIKLYWSNGNENYDKGALSPGPAKGAQHTAAQVAAYTTSQRALYDAVHYVDPSTGQRRYPDAYAGSNPTQYGELQGWIQAWLHPTARYHDFVMWSMYPPGREQGSDPIYNWPSMLEADRLNLRLGFLGRCFYRTVDAQAAARAATGNPNFRLIISCGEIGTGDMPGLQNARPYYAVHSLAGGIQKLASRTGLDCHFANWWDNSKNPTATQPDPPENILSDEPDGTTPSTREAWQNWRQYNHEFGGTHPGSWAGLPGAIPTAKKTGPVV